MGALHYEKTWTRIIIICVHISFSENNNSKLVNSLSWWQSIIKEQDKLIHMGALKACKKQVVLAGETKNVQAKGKQKGKDKKNYDIKPKAKHNPL